MVHQQVRWSLKQGTRKVGRERGQKYEQRKRVKSEKVTGNSGVQVEESSRESRGYGD